MALLHSWKSPNIFLHKHRSEKKIISFITDPQVIRQIL